MNVSYVKTFAMVMQLRDFEIYEIIFTTVYLLLQIFPSFVESNLLVS
jgi:hypothetical protein